MQNLGKRTLCILCAMVMILSMIVLPENDVQAASDSLDLSAMQIVIPAAPTSVESTAATELQTYIYKITGTKPAIKSEGSNSGACIYIGATNFARLKGVTYPTDGDENGEAWAIKTLGNHLFLCGAPARGPLYAVYHLLEDVLGVHWWNLWEEYVPTGSALVPKGYADSGVPAMEYRDIFVGLETATDYPFYVRNRLNGFTTNIPENYGGEESYGYAHVHTFNRYITANDFASNPEWFALIDGARVADGQLCLTNTSLQTTFASRMFNEIGKDADAIYSVSPGDFEKFCECSACQSEINTYGMSGYVLRFVNKMAEAVTQEGFTDATLEMLVYWAYLDAPKGGVVPADNVQIRFAYNPFDIMHSVSHANNAAALTKLQQWADICSNNIYYWQYVVHYNNNGIVPSMYYYGDDMVKLLDMGVNGWFAEQEHCINADFWDMKLWLLAKLMEEPVSGDAYDALMDEFIYGYYGKEPGKYIRQYLDLMHTKAEATNVSQSFGINIIAAEWLSVSDIIAAHNYFEQAFAAAGNDATLLRRLRAARSGLDRVIIENFYKWQTEAQSAGLTLPFTEREVGERIDYTITEQMALRGKYYDDTPGLANRYDRFVPVDTTRLPSNLAGYAGEHMFEYTTDDFRRGGDFSYTSIVSDSESLVGTAFRSDTAGNTNIKLSSFKPIKMYAYNPGGTSHTIGSITFNNAKGNVNQGYALYEFSWTVPALNDGGYVYMFEDWGLQIPTMTEDLQAWEGKTVKIYVSMKITGTVGSYSFSGNPVYYIDRVLVLLTPNSPSHAYTATPAVYSDQCRKVCSACGDVVLAEHTWNDGVVTVEPTVNAEGQKAYTCTTCGATKTETLEKLPVQVKTTLFEEIPEKHLVALRDHSYFSAAPDEGTNYVDDTEAYGGKAVCYSRTTLDNNSFVSIYRYDVASGLSSDELHIGNISNEDLKGNIGKGYQTYKFTYNVPTATTEGNVFYIMNNWQLNSAQFCKDFAAYAGKTVEVYLSLKVTGPVEGYYSIWLDGVALATICDDNMSEDGVYCTVCGKTDAFLAQIPNGHRDVIKTYSAFSENSAQNTSHVTDADAYEQKAVCHIENNLSVAIQHYNSAGTTEIGNLSADQLKVGQGYQIHKFTYKVPANAAKDGYVFIMSSWQFQSSELSIALHDYAGKTVEMYFSMKVTGPVDGQYSIYIDRVALASICADFPNENGTACAKCGKKYAILDVLQSAGHIYANYTHAQIDGSEPRAEDPDAYADGKAVIAQNMDLSSTGLNFYACTAGAATVVQLDSIEPGKLLLNQGYQLYKLSASIPESLTESVLTYFTAGGSGWKFVNPSGAACVNAFAGKQLDVYVSLKVEGTLDNATCYVDRMVFVDACENHNENDYCSVCGKSLSAQVFLAEDINLPYSPTDTMVSDSDSPYGKAVKLSYDARYPTGDAGLINAMIFGEEEHLALYTYDGSASVLVGSISRAELLQNGEAGKYVTYTFENVELIPEDSNITMVYMFDCWGLQTKFEERHLNALRGKLVNVTVSLKVTGVAYSADVTPSYYIDCITYEPVKPHEHAHGDWTYVDENNHSATCECGDVITGTHSWNAGVVTIQPTQETEGEKLYTCSDCGGTKTEVLAKLPSPATSWNLVLDGNIAVNFHLNVTASQIAAATVDVTVNGNTASTDVSALPIDGKTQLPVLTVELAAAQMTDVITVTVHADGQDITKNYTVRGYADYILDPANGYDAKVVALVKHMLNYGAASQTHFKYNPDNLANADVEIEEATVPTEANAAIVSGDIRGLVFYGASLVHENKVAVRFYFSGSVEGVDFGCLEVKTKDDLYYVEIADIAPQNLDQNIVLALTKDGDTLTVTYAPMDYIIRMYNKAGSADTTKALVQALYGYYAAAEAYLA